MRFLNLIGNIHLNQKNIIKKMKFACVFINAVIGCVPFEVQYYSMLIPICDGPKAINGTLNMRGSGKLFQRGSSFDIFFS